MLCVQYRLKTYKYNAKYGVLYVADIDNIVD